MVIMYYIISLYPSAHKFFRNHWPPMQILCAKDPGFHLVSLDSRFFSSSFFSSGRRPSPAGPLSAFFLFFVFVFSFFVFVFSV